jgi:hypothetical protein
VDDTLAVAGLADSILAAYTRGVIISSAVVGVITAAGYGAVGIDLWLVGQSVPEIPNATVFSLPDFPEILSPLLAVVPMQMLAYEMAVLKSLNPDTFRRDDEVFKNALSVLTL